MCWVLDLSPFWTLETYGTREMGFHHKGIRVLDIVGRVTLNLGRLRGVLWDPYIGSSHLTQRRSGRGFLRRPDLSCVALTYCDVFVMATAFTRRFEDCVRCLAIVTATLAVYIE